MDNIYWYSRNTIIWLGEFDSTEDAASFAVLLKIFQSRGATGTEFLTYKVEGASLRDLLEGFFKRSWLGFLGRVCLHSFVVVQ